MSRLTFSASVFSTRTAVVALTDRPPERTPTKLTEGNRTENWPWNVEAVECKSAGDNAIAGESGAGIGVAISLFGFCFG